MNTIRVFLKQPCLDLSVTILPMRPLPRSILALTATLLFTAFAVPESHSQQFLSGSSISFKDSEGYQVSLFLPEGVMEQQVMQNRILWNRALPINFKNHGLHNYRARTIYYEEILKELIMQPVVGSFYFLDELFAETPNTVFDKDIRAKWIMLMFILGEAGETVNPFEESILEFDERYIGSTLKTLSRGFDFAEFYKLNPQLDAFLSRMNLPFNTEQAVKAIEEIEVARTVLTVRREINTIAKTMTLIAAMNMDNALRKLEDLRVLNNTLNDPAFEQALENTYLVFENMNQDFWATMFFSLRESLDEISTIGEAIITITPAFKAAKKKITAKLTAAGFNTPTLFAFYFTYDTLVMLQDHNQSAKRATIALTLHEAMLLQQYENEADLHYAAYLYFLYWSDAYYNWAVRAHSFVSADWRYFRDYLRNEKELSYQRLIDFHVDRLLQQRVIERQMTLNICDVWTVANSGGVEGTIDYWDISVLPYGALLDLRYNMFRIPDKLTVEYPAGYLVADTGWRGSSGFAGPSYPGGIQGPGQDQMLGVFQREEHNAFIVTVTGVDSNTLWEYQVRCRVPE